MEFELKLLNRDKIIKTFSAILLLIGMTVEMLNIFVFKNDIIHHILYGVVITNLLYTILWNVIKIINFINFVKAYKDKE